MTNNIAKIRAALEMARDYITSDLASERGAFEGYEGLSRIDEIKADLKSNESALAALAELEKAAGEPVAYQYAHPYFGGGKIWREEQRWNGHTSDEARALYTTPPPAKPAPGMFTADEMEAAWRDAYANGDNTEASRSNQDFWWPRSATFKLIQERTK